MGLSRLWLLCIVFWDAPLTTALVLHTWSEGLEESVLCSWSYENLTVSRRAFCRGDCQQDMLVQTSDLGPQTHGRYSIKHQIQGSPPEDTITVTISNLTPNDSGQYGCLWEGSNRMNYQEFKVEVTDGNKMQNFPSPPTPFSSPFYNPNYTHYYNLYTTPYDDYDYYFFYYTS
ncbi:unnamed protein product [Knipowitschia caucasica]|uniref:Immunoglobulin V-set domain-containing protein n=1 Tax=Knipowitschia caucasica TaxID=637954 RepID=A0AAV2KXI4_KNICA